MEYIYAAMILHSAEKDINEENVKGIIEAAGIDADDARVKALIAALEDVDIEEAIMQLKKKRKKKRKKKKLLKKKQQLD